MWVNGGWVGGWVNSGLVSGEFWLVGDGGVLSCPHPKLQVYCTHLALQIKRIHNILFFAN